MPVLTVEQLRFKFAEMRRRGSVLFLMGIRTVPELKPVLFETRAESHGVVLTCKTVNPYLGRIHKESILDCSLDPNYEDSVNRQRVREGKVPDFIAEDRAWGDRVEHEPLVDYNGEMYLRCHELCRLSEVWYLDDRPVDASVVIPLLKPKSNYKKQQLARPRKHINPKLRNIRWMRFGGEEFEVQP